MATIVKTTFQLKRGSAAKWAELNLILAPGEPGYEIDTGRLKIGNGSAPWNELVYFNGGGGGASGDIVVDTTLSKTSNNPIANKAVAIALEALEAKIPNFSYSFGNGLIVEENNGVSTISVDFDAIKALIPQIDMSGLATKEDLEIITNALLEIRQAIQNLTIPSKLSELENDADFISQSEVAQAIQDLKNYQDATKFQVRYEVMPHEGVFADYNGSEIRINTQRVIPHEQSVGPTGAKNQYYIAFRAYAPEGATHYKEWENDNKDDTLYDFSNSFAGTDEYGRNYSLIWMSVASFNGTNWTLYGDLSTAEKYLGFRYTHEWYKDGQLIDSNQVRVILTNDKCHNELVAEPTVKYVDSKINNIVADMEILIEEKVEAIITEGVPVSGIRYGSF